VRRWQKAAFLKRWEGFWVGSVGSFFNEREGMTGRNVRRMVLQFIASVATGEGRGVRGGGAISGMA